MRDEIKNLVEEKKVVEQLDRASPNQITPPQYLLGGGYPAHCPYEDAWKFCRQCQRFYKTEEERCFIHKEKCFTLRISPGCSRGRNTESKKRTKQIGKNGCGLPKWAFFPEYAQTQSGLKAIKEFRLVQEKLFSRIKSAPFNKKISLKELGANKFENHWFIKTFDEEVEERK